MSKQVADAVFNAGLAVIATANWMDVVSDSSTPTDLTNTLAKTAMTVGDGNDYAIAAGTPSGRKITTVQKSGVTITAAGTPRHVVLSVWSGTRGSGGSLSSIPYITTCTGADLALNNTVTFPAFSYTMLQVS